MTGNFGVCPMKQLLILCAVFFLFVSLAGANDPKPVTDAERAFSRLATDKSTRAAFLEYLAEGSVIFAKGPTDARKLYESRPENATLLFWLPEAAEISAAGDMGYSTGPWEWSKARGEKPEAYGHFISI